MSGKSPENRDFGETFEGMSDEELAAVSRSLRNELWHRNKLAKRPSYEELFEDAYIVTETAVAEQVEADRIAEEYRLPPIGEFEDQFDALQTTHQRMRSRKGWIPKVVFAPVGLPVPAWNGIIGSYLEEDDSFWSTPAVDDGERLGAKIDLPIAAPKDGRYWDVALTTVRPVLENISADGRHGSKGNRQRARAALSLLLFGRQPAEEETSLAELIQRASPAHHVHFADQLGNLASGIGFANKFTFIFGKEDVPAEKGDGQARLCYAQRQKSISLSRVRPAYHQSAKSYGPQIKPTVTAAEAVANQA